MAAWQQVKIGDVCVVERGGSPRPIEKFITENENGVNWIKIGDTSESMYITKTAQKIIPEGVKKSRFVQAGDFLLSNSMSFGRPYILSIDGCIHDGWLVLRDKDNLFDKHFLYYCLSAPVTYVKFKSMAVGGVVNNLNSEMVRNIEIPLPALEEQRRIAALLDKVSDLIAKRRAQLDKLDLLVKARFVEMFGDQHTNPKGWEIGRIRDVVNEVKYGTSRPAAEGGAYKYLRMGNITFDGHLDLNDLKYIDIPDSEIEKYMVRKGDVLFNRTNSKELVGKTCVFDLDEPMVIAGYIIRVRVNERVIPEYLSAVLNSQYGKQTLSDMCKAIVGQANINAQELQNIAILIPPIELQREFALFVHRVNRLVSNVTDEIEKLETLKKALMQKFFG